MKEKLHTLVCLVVFLLTSSVLVAQEANVAMSFGGNGDISVCTEIQEMIVNIEFKGIADTILEFRFPEGIYYKRYREISSPPSDLDITFVDGSDSTRPRFHITHSTTSNRKLRFAVSRSAHCFAGDGNESLCDTLLIYSENTAVKTYISDHYTILKPDYSLTTPEDIPDAVVGCSYSRTRELKNGSVAPSKTVYIAYAKPDNIRLDSLTWRYNSGESRIATPYLVDENVYYFLLKDFSSENQLFSDGDLILITENITLTGCATELGAFKVGWMCEEDLASNEDDWCQIIEGTSLSVLSKISDPRLGSRIEYENFENLCKEWSYVLSIWNSSTDNSEVSAYYNVELLTAFSAGISEGNFDTAVTKLSGVEMLMANGDYAPVAYELRPADSKDQYLHIDFSQFNKPASLPSGLSAISLTDTIYNDLLPGDTLKLRIKQEWKCSDNCGRNASLDVPWLNINAKTMCGDPKTEREKPEGGKLIRENPSNSPLLFYDLNIQMGAQHRYTMNLEGSTKITENVLNSQDSSRWQWYYDFPGGISIKSIYYYEEGDVEYETPVEVESGEDFRVEWDPVDTNKVTITTTKNKLYLIHVDFNYTPPSENCGADRAFQFEMRRIDYQDGASSCLCSEKIVCKSFDLNLVCPGNCDLGPINYLPLVRRVDGCLGYKDYNFTERCVPEDLSVKQLQRAIPTDTIRMISRMKQVGTPDSLFLRVETVKAAGKETRLAPIKAVVEFYDNSAIVSEMDLSGTDCRITDNGSSSLFTWDLSNKSTDFDSVSVVSYYYLKNLTKEESGLNSSGFEQQGLSHYFYNKRIGDDNIHICYAGNFIPEFYMVTPETSATTSTVYHNGCDETTLTVYFSDAVSWYGRNPFPNEIRPARYWDSLYVKIEEGIILNSALLTGGYGDARATDFALPDPVFNGDTMIYLFRNDKTWRTGSLGTNHSSLVMKVQYTCDNSESLMYGVDAFYKSIYANAVAVSEDTPAPIPEKGFINRETSSKSYLRKLDGEHPRVTTQAQVNSRLKGLTGKWTLNVRNLTTIAAPNVWIAIDTNDNIQISRISVGDVDLEDVGNYLNGLWLKMDTLQGKAEKNVEIEYTYIECCPDTLPVSIGWDCDRYPESLSSSRCAVIHSKLIHPRVNSSIELDQKKISETGNVCDTLLYEYVYNNKGEGNSINNIFILKLPPGLVLLEDSLKMQYPNASSNPLELGRQISKETIGDTVIYVYSIDSISTFPHQIGMPGVFQADHENDRKAYIRFLLVPSCDFVPRSLFKMQVKANHLCGDNEPCGNSEKIYYSPMIKLKNLPDSLYNSNTNITLESVENIDQTSLNSKILELTVNSKIYNVVAGEQQPRRAIYSLRLPDGVVIDDQRVENLSIDTLTTAVGDDFIDSNPYRFNFYFSFADDLENGDSIKFKVALSLSGLSACNEELPVEISSYLEYAGLPCGSGKCDFSNFILVEKKIQNILFEDAEAPQLICPADFIYKVSLDEQCSAQVSFPKAIIGFPTVTDNVSVDSIWNNAPDILSFPTKDTTAIVTWHGRDHCGNQSSCEQAIQIRVCPCAFDADGNRYLSAWVGEYCWTLSNAKTTRYTTLAPVEFAKGYHAEQHADIENNINLFGRLYTWYSAVGIPENSDASPDTTGSGHIQGICPEGWHIPSLAEVENLLQFSASNLKSDLFWLHGMTGDNATRFSALPAGIYNGLARQYYYLLGDTYFWYINNPQTLNGTSSVLHLHHTCDAVEKKKLPTSSAVSVRCVKE